MSSLHQQLNDLLLSDERLKSQNGQLLKNLAQELARKNDPNLIRLLISDQRIKDHFFVDVDGTLIFDKEKFIRFITSKQFLPDSYTAFKNKIGLSVDNNYISEKKDVVLAWAYKDCVLEGGLSREDQKWDEVFYNEILAKDEIDRLLDPKVFTEFKRIDKDSEHSVSRFTRDITGLLKENFIIKGNNLLVISSLERVFAGQAKLIYIDPPYNTGGPSETFTYNNSFNHSTWLTFMKNRLVAAKTLLREDGFLAITIDHVELFYLGVLLDEVYGRENRVGIVTILINPKGRQHEQFFSAATEYMLVYAKNKDVAHFNRVAIDDDIKLTFNKTDDKGNFRLIPFSRIRTSTLREFKPNFWYPIYVSPDLSDVTHERFLGYHEIYPVENGNEYSWKTKLETFIERNHDNYFIAKEIDSRITILHKYYEQQVLKNLWTDKKYFPEFQGTNLLKNLLGENIFSYPKSLYAVIDTLKIMTSEDDLIIDFFSGSGTTAHAVLTLNKEDDGKRQFILVEQLSKHIDITLKRINKVLKKENDVSSYIYCQLKTMNEVWIDQVMSATSSIELVSIWEEMSKKAFLSYKVDPKTINENISDFKELSIENQKRFLIECLDKNHLYINYSEIEDQDYGLTEEEIRLNREFYK